MKYSNDKEDYEDDLVFDNYYNENNEFKNSNFISSRANRITSLDIMKYNTAEAKEYFLTNKLKDSLSYLSLEAPLLEEIIKKSIIYKKKLNENRFNLPLLTIAKCLIYISIKDRLSYKKDNLDYSQLKDILVKVDLKKKEYMNFSYILNSINESSELKTEEESNYNELDLKEENIETEFLFNINNGEVTVNKDRITDNRSKNEQVIKDSVIKVFEKLKSQLSKCFIKPSYSKQYNSKIVNKFCESLVFVNGIENLTSDSLILLLEKERTIEKLLMNHDFNTINHKIVIYSSAIVKITLAKYFSIKTKLVSYKELFNIPESSLSKLASLINSII